MLKSSKIFLSTIITFATVLMAPTSFGADSEIFCGCVEVGDDVALSLFADRCHEEATVLRFYTRSTVRAPKSGEIYRWDGFGSLFIIAPCNVDINGTAGCQQDIYSGYEPEEPIACLGSGQRKKTPAG